MQSLPSSLSSFFYISRETFTEDLVTIRCIKRTLKKKSLAISTKCDVMPIKYLVNISKNKFILLSI